MSYPADILLPATAKCFSAKNTTGFNINHDITWSISYKVSGANTQYGLCTFLNRTTSSPLSVLSGQYLGTYVPNNVISIAFDTTGLFALSSAIRPGVSMNQVQLSSLVVRTSSNQVIYNQSITDKGFKFYNTHQIIRCRYSPAQQQLFVDYRDITNSNFINLATISFELPYNLTPSSGLINPLSAGFSFITPISTTSTSVASAAIYNFHVDGVNIATTFETITSLPLT